MRVTIQLPVDARPDGGTSVQRGLQFEIEADDADDALRQVLNATLQTLQHDGVDVYSAKVASVGL